MLLQQTNVLSNSSQPPPQISLSSQKQECQQQQSDSNNPTNHDTTELMDSVLDSSELEEVKKIEEHSRKTLQLMALYLIVMEEIQRFVSIEWS